VTTAGEGRWPRSSRSSSTSRTEASGWSRRTRSSLWSTSRRASGTQSEAEGRFAGYDLAVFRVADGTIAEAWFFPDGFDLDELSEVFSVASGP
jgi:hypothetical protein